MKIRFVSASLMIGFLASVSVYVALAAGPPPESWERPRCPYPNEELVWPHCSTQTPDTGVRPSPEGF